MSFLSKYNIKQDQVWQFLLVIAYFFLTFNFFDQRFGHTYALIKAGLLIGAQIILWQVNLKFLIPSLLLKKKYLFYGAALFIITLSIATLYNRSEKRVMDSWRVEAKSERLFPFDAPEEEQNQYNRNRMRGENRAKRFFTPPKIFESLYNFILFSVVALLSTAYRMTVYSLKKENEATLLREEKVKSEMSFLKSQVNPHFLFNVLNNIYSLSFLKSDKTPDVVLQLSDMLRYMLYHTGTETVPLSQEVEYLQNFISLHLLKDDTLHERVKYDINISSHHLQIAPLLFAPFIENAFKHSHIEDEQNGWISISLETEKNNTILFNVSNSKPSRKISKDKEGGIGLENVKKRLTLQYKNKHILTINETHDRFSVTLELHTS
ncbi:histidine kinase [Flammeovirga sp. SubArs3]|uniref:sensor histidine kinase n=1 Tax=Flammeovirga sp. SubArs3 TaxID=2995316 RepID=UPI00248AD89B|nr:histidine kinase [Flammeovirga sp. SubArs3]